MFATQLSPAKFRLGNPADVVVLHGYGVHTDCVYGARHLIRRSYGTRHRRDNRQIENAVKKQEGLT